MQNRIEARRPPLPLAWLYPSGTAHSPDYGLAAFAGVAAGAGTNHFGNIGQPPTAMALKNAAHTKPQTQAYADAGMCSHSHFIVR